MSVILTEIQAATLEYIKDYIKINTFPPSRADIAEAFEIQPNAAQSRVEGLIRKGAIDRIANVSRSIVPVKGFRVRIK